MGVSARLTKATDKEVDAGVGDFEYDLNGRRVPVPVSSAPPTF